MTADGVVFGARLCAYRRSAGLSQAELAERSGLSVRAVRDLERGRTRCPYPDTVHQLADALGLRAEVRAAFAAAAGRRLAGTAAGSVIAAGGDRLPTAGEGRVVPRQLPGPVRQFTGRQNELAALTGLLDPAGACGPAAVVISALGGMAGVGKTALAVHWAHQVASQFPDGQLFVNLRGYDCLLYTSPVRLVLDVLLVPERRLAAVERHRHMGRPLIAQHVDEHRGEAVDGVGRLPRRGREVLGGQREKRPVGEGMPVEQKQPVPLRVWIGRPGRVLGSHP